MLIEFRKIKKKKIKVVHMVSNIQCIRHIKYGCNLGRKGMNSYGKHWMVGTLHSPTCLSYDTVVKPKNIKECTVYLPNKKVSVNLNSWKNTWWHLGQGPNNTEKHFLMSLWWLVQQHQLLIVFDLIIMRRN